MAKQMEGYMGGFSGTLGTAVGYRWNGVWCMRSRPTRVHNPRTEKQMAHRGMFKAEVQLAARMRWAVNSGLLEAAREAHMTAYNLFVSLNQPCFTLDEGEFKVDYAALALSCGTAAPVAVAAATAEAGNVLKVSFEKNPLHLSCSQFDRVYLYVYAPAAGQGYLAAPVYRRSKSVAVALPEIFAGEQVHLYLMVQNERGMWSETAYAGSMLMEVEAETPSPDTDDMPSSMPQKTGVQQLMLFEETTVDERSAWTESDGAQPGRTAGSRHGLP